MHIWKVMMNKLNGCIFWLKTIFYRKNIILFGIKSPLILKKNFIASMSKIKKIENQNKVIWRRSYRFFNIKKFLRWTVTELFKMCVQSGWEAAFHFIHVHQYCTPKSYTLKNLSSKQGESWFIVYSSLINIVCLMLYYESACWKQTGEYILIYSKLTNILHLKCSTMKNMCSKQAGVCF